jgi:hypothetical protein
MNAELIDRLTQMLIEYRKDKGVSAAMIVAAALVMGYEHGVNAVLSRLQPEITQAEETPELLAGT